MVTDQPSRLFRTFSLVIATLSIPHVHAQNPSLPTYSPTRQVTGVIRIWGSPQMGNLLHRYEEGFQKAQPFVRFESSLKSTITAVAGVYTDRADIGLLGREIWPSEEQAFESITGHLPVAIEIATGAYDVPKATYTLMIFVHRSNPITSLSTAQLDYIFGGASNISIRTWGDLGLKGAWATRSIHLYGFSGDNDKSLIFSRLIFKQSTRWNCTLHEYANTSSDPTGDAGNLIVKAVAEDPSGIGISNIHYSTQDVKALPLSSQDSESPIAPTRENVASRRYPLFRAVYMVINRGKDNPTYPTVSEFIHYVLSRQGQEDVLNEGTYIPLTPDIAEKQRRLLDLP